MLLPSRSKTAYSMTGLKSPRFKVLGYRKSERSFTITGVNSQRTIFLNRENGKVVGSQTFILPSISEGLQITMKGGNKTDVFIFKSWEYVFSSFEEDKSGLIVQVDVLT